MVLGGQEPGDHLGIHHRAALGHAPDIWLFAGRFRTGADHFEICRQLGESEKAPYLLALGLRHICLALCWIDAETTLRLVDEAETLNRDLNLPPGIAQCLMARAVAAIGSAPLADIDNLLADADATFLRAGYADDALGPPAVGVLAAAATGNHDLAQARRSELVARSEGRRTRTWLAAADVWTGNHEHFDRVTWPQGSEQAFVDWTDVLTTRANQ